MYGSIAQLSRDITASQWLFHMGSNASWCRGIEEEPTPPPVQAADAVAKIPDALSEEEENKVVPGHDLARKTLKASPDCTPNPSTVAACYCYRLR